MAADMKHAVAVVLFALLSACSQRTAPVAAAEAAEPVAQAVASEDDCTLQTPLVPGIPGSPGHLIPTDRNPNGASELAMHMRKMQQDVGDARDALLRGETPKPLYASHRKLRCAWPTTPEDRNDTFDAMAVAYLAQVRALDEHPTDLRAAHDAVVSGCVACHEQTCQGPIEAIQKLRLPK